jgi:tRNA(adenine34) deaminase
MSVDDHHMHLAIETAHRSSEPLKCGAVIVKDGVVIVQTHNSQRADNDASAHAEIKAIREAGTILGIKSLAGCVAYCTCEPCVMCMAALSYAKIDKIVFGSALSEVSPPEKLIRIDLDAFLEQAPHRP